MTILDFYRIDFNTGAFGILLFLITGALRVYRQIQNRNAKKHIVISIISTPLFAVVWSIVGFLIGWGIFIISNDPAVYSTENEILIFRTALFIWITIGVVINLSYLGVWGASIGSLAGLIGGFLIGLVLGTLMGLVLLLFMDISDPGIDISNISFANSIFIFIVSSLGIGTVAGFFTAMFISPVTALLGGSLGLVIDLGISSGLLAFEKKKIFNHV